jgi:ABC-2 type transport system permease protein
MRRYLKLFGWFTLLHLKTLLEYRADFLVGIISQFCIQGGGVTAAWVVMRQIPNLNGWNFNEVLLIQGLVFVAFALSNIFTNNLWFIGGYIRTGAFDRLLIRPIDPLFHLVIERFNKSGVGDLIAGAAIITLASSALGVVWTPFKLLYLLIALVTGATIFTGTYLITAVTAFWIINSHPVTFVVFKNFEFVKFPIDIYPSTIRLMLTWVIPYAFISFYPASYILGRDTGLMAWMGVVVAAVLLFIGRRLWFVGLRRYASTGS